MAVEYPLMRVTLVSTFRNQVALNVLHYGTSFGTAFEMDAAAMAAFALNVATTLTTEFKECLSQDAEYKGMKVRQLSSNPANDQEIVTTFGSGVGTADTPGTEPSQLCGLIRKRTIVAGHKGRGRFYMPFVPEGAPDPDDLVSGAYQTVLNDLGDAIATSFPTAVGGSSPTFFPLLVTGRDVLPFRVIISGVAAEGFATQRRRGYFGAPNVSPI